jgi:hypothetical protein
LEEVPARIALAEHALETTPQELFVTELRGVPPVAAVVAQQPQNRLEKRLAHRLLIASWFHVTIL